MAPGPGVSRLLAFSVFRAELRLVQFVAEPLDLRGFITELPDVRWLLEVKAALSLCRLASWATSVGCPHHRDA